MSEEEEQRITGIIIPEGAVLVGEIAVVSYLDEEGTERWGASVGGEMLQSHIIGLLQMVQNEYLNA